MDMENGASKKLEIGSMFGDLIVIGIDKGKTKTKTYYKCKCSCGEIVSVRQDHLVRGETTSCKKCGWVKTGLSRKKYFNGEHESRLYRIWRNIHTRCNTPTSISYPNYGGRGITVCPEWSDYRTFEKWAFEAGYADDLTIDRIDNNGNYEPSNCRWATVKEQALNRRSNAYITYNGVTKHISEWDKDIGAKKSGRVRARLNAGWSIERAVTTPV